MGISNAKVFIVGESLDWTKRKCLLYSLPLSMSMTITDEINGGIKILDNGREFYFENKNIKEFIPNDSFYDYMNAGLYLWNKEICPVNDICINITSYIPPKGGLGSSAATLVSLFRTLRDYCSVEIEDKDICNLGLRVENELLGATVGLADFYMCMGCMGKNALLLDAKKNACKYFDFTLNNASIVLIFSGHTSSTKDVNKNKYKRYIKKEPMFMKYLDLTEQLVEASYNAMLNRDYIELGKYITESHQLISKLLGTSNKKIDALVDMCNSCGAYGSKLTGCGMGGYVFSIIDFSKYDKLKFKLELMGQQFITIL